MKIGDSVKVVDSGLYYPSYDRMLEIMNIITSEIVKPENGDTGVVINIQPHTFMSPIVVAVILNKGGITLMDSRGLKIIEDYNIETLPLLNF